MSSTNPIEWVCSYEEDENGDEVLGDKESVQCPSDYQLDLQDVSASDAGRTEDTVMHKNMLGQCVSVSLAWNYVTDDILHNLVTTFNHEYIKMRYKDIYKGEEADDYFREAVFYVGDRSSPMYNSSLGLWKKVSFKVVERSGTDD